MRSLCVSALLDPQRDRAFRAHGLSRIGESVAECESERLEGGFDHVMPIASAKYENVDGRPRLVAERAHPVIVQTTWQRPLVVRSPADVHRDLNERVVHRHDAIP